MESPSAKASVQSHESSYAHRTFVARSRVRRAAAATEALRRRLAVQSLEARKRLAPLAACPVPQRSVYNDSKNSCGIFCGFYLPGGVPLCPNSTNVVTQMQSLGGLADVRFLLSVASLVVEEVDGHGEVDMIEWETYENEGEQYLQGVRTLCDNAAVVCSIMLGLTHLVTIGRPVRFEVSSLWATEAAGQAWMGEAQQALLWLAYGCNVLSELAALGTLVLAVSCRSILLTMLPSLEQKIEWIAMIRPIRMQTHGISLVFSSFSVSIALCALVSSPTFGWVAVAMVMISSWIVGRIRARMLYAATVRPYLANLTVP